ncbi:hypothetical protein AQZ52_07965 [Novosphingobium fuchskuhlense]|jgi:hypothetical protein|uniref:Uncharacterized protein n=1 Tax=Novosphingobium fuchskuhlense TaxID=1117702 RepID=A0A117UW62_9SPHN|nr:hypothetical protein AQZ52_07965 [Novosphingobium fuchskuhlense]
MSGFFKRLRCLFGRHSPARRLVQYEGHLKVGPCRHCGRPLEKGAEGKWVPRIRPHAGPARTAGD